MMQRQETVMESHMPLTIGVPRETAAGEKRVATVPEVVEKLIKLGFAVAVESGAGDAANISDDAYRAAGAEIVADAARLWSSSDIIFKVRGPSAAEVGLMREGSTLVSFIWPAQNPELLQQLAARKATVLAIDSLPRTLSRAQKMDALTSQAGVAGYRAVIEAANAFGRFFNGQITAAGKVPPAKVFIRRWRRRPGGDWHCRQPRRHRSRQRHACRSGRSGRVAGR
jgi:NAD(P) transhydrogenase subunit alpha